MKHKLLGLSVLLACAGAQVHAVGRLADVSVVDRVSGAVLSTYYHRGEYWVAGRPGARYAIRIHNKMGERLMAVTSVDGVNVVSGETAAVDQTGYVISSYLQYQIAGWRKSDSEVAAFEFVATGDSYAARTGRPDNTGVIGVALFREKVPEPVARAPELTPRNSFSGGSSLSRSDAAGAPPPATSPWAQAMGPLGAMPDRSAEPSPVQQPSDSLSFSERRAKASAEAMPTPKLGTAHGQRETSAVSSTNFQRLQSHPNEIIRIRYDSRENLIAGGVIREPVAQMPLPRANAFPMSEQSSYVPDPPARRY